MIKNAQEAREIVDAWGNCQDISITLPSGITSGNTEKHFSKGYLAALNGPEVKALVEALEESIERMCERSEGCECGPNENDCDICNRDKKAIRISLESIDSYRAAAKSTSVEGR